MGFFTQVYQLERQLCSEPGQEHSSVLGSIRSLYVTLFTSLLPPWSSTPDQDSGDVPQGTQICSLALLVLSGGGRTLFPKIFHAPGPVVQPEIMEKFFLPPFLIAADDNDVLCKINT